MIQKRVFVSGRVQGVGFRASTIQAAAAYPAIGGFVRNLPDGRVEAVFRGPARDVESMVEWCRKGPPGARVAAIDVIEEEPAPSLGPFKLER